MENIPAKQKTAYEMLGIPGSLSIKGYIYTYKTELKDKYNFVYRCKNRECHAQITIDKDNILKILSKNKEEDIVYREGKNAHTCINKINDTKIEKKKEYLLIMKLIP